MFCSQNSSHLSFFFFFLMVCLYLQITAATVLPLQEWVGMAGASLDKLTSWHRVPDPGLSGSSPWPDAWEVDGPAGSQAGTVCGTKVQDSHPQMAKLQSLRWFWSQSPGCCDKSRYVGTPERWMGQFCYLSFNFSLYATPKTKGQDASSIAMGGLWERRWERLARSWKFRAQARRGGPTAEHDGKGLGTTEETGAEVEGTLGTLT